MASCVLGFAGGSAIGVVFNKIGLFILRRGIRVQYFLGSDLFCSPLTDPSMRVIYLFDFLGAVAGSAIYATITGIMISYLMHEDLYNA